MIDDLLYIFGLHKREEVGWVINKVIVVIIVLEQFYMVVCSFERI